MSWSLEADVEYKGEPMKLVEPFISFYNKDIFKARIHVQKGDYPFEEIEEVQLDANVNLNSVIIENIKKYVADDIRITINFYLDAIKPKYFPVIELVVYGNKLRNNCLRRRSSIVIGFGNRNAWRGETSLSHTGRKLDEILIISFLKYFCLEIRPESLYFVNEEQVSIPFNDHFVYHSDISGFLVDLNDIIKLCLYGGKGYYNDGRQTYEAALYEEKTMLLCNRKGEHREKFREYLISKLPILESKGSLNIERDMVENAVLKYNDVMDFFTDSDGLGIFSIPLFDKYVEMFYISLIDDLSDETNTIGKSNIRLN